MARTYYTGIDVGTHQVKVVIAAPADRPDLPMPIIGSGSALSRGMRHGYIIDKSEVAKSIREALLRAGTAAKVSVRSARVAVGGVGLDELRSTAEVSLTASGGIVTERDVERVLRESENRASTKLSNRTVLHTIPLEFRVDGSRIFGKPVGVLGTKLSADTLLITALTAHYDELIDAVEAAGVEVVGLMASPLAASLVTLNKSQKTAGVCLANVGSETLSIIVFEEDRPISVKVFSLGSSDITNALALSFQIPLTEAEQMKRGAVTGTDVSQRKMQSLIAGKLKEMFVLINMHLKQMGRAGLLPAGIVLTGGGSGLFAAAEVAKTVLKLPSSVGTAGLAARSASVDVTWAVAYGLCRWGYADDTSLRGSSLVDIFRRAADTIKDNIRSLLP